MERPEYQKEDNTIEGFRNLAEYKRNRVIQHTSDVNELTDLAEQALVKGEFAHASLIRNRIGFYRSVVASYRASAEADEKEANEMEAFLRNLIGEPGNLEQPSE